MKCVWACSAAADDDEEGGGEDDAVEDEELPIEKKGMNVDAAHGMGMYKHTIWREAWVRPQLQV